MGFISFFRSLLNRLKPDGNEIALCVLGLGNPGDTYCNTRHNIGFRIVDYLNERLLNKTKIIGYYSEIVKGTLDNKITVVTIKPQTFMNKSGIAAAQVKKRYVTDNTKFIIIVDDFNLPLGTIRIRQDGSHGGHNGLKSVIEAIGQDFVRLRIGIGPLPDNNSVIDFVLGNFSNSELPILNAAIKKSFEAVKLYAFDTIECVMNNYN